jgi:uncharacterized damage-inducible protein DinB
MASLVERLLGNLDSVFEKSGWGWHPPLLPSVEHLTAAQAAFVSEGRNSIWKIVEHMALWKAYMAGRMAGQPKRPAGWAKEADWKALPEVTDEAWQATIRRLIDAQAGVKAELTRRSDDELNQTLPGTDVPLSAIIQGIIAHDSYHCGQIHYIRAIQGIAVES